MSWSSRKKKEGIFCTVYFVRKKFFNICALSQYIEYTFRICTLLHIENHYFIHFFTCFKNRRRLHPAGNKMVKLNNRNTRTRCEICSKLTIKIPERRHWRRFGIFIINFEQISHLVLVFLLLTLSR